MVSPIVCGTMARGKVGDGTVDEGGASGRSDADGGVPPFRAAISLVTLSIQLRAFS